MRSNSEMAEFQGPSLLVYNDSIFSEEDFDSICSIGNSRKKTDVKKIGRFGLGFNSGEQSFIILQL